MNYEEAVAYLENIPKFTKKTSLDHTDRLLDELGHPEEGMKIFHVAGTNGKGSVCAFLEAMLREGGYRVGLFTSPHLVRINERFRIDGRDVPDGEFVRAFERVMEAAEKRMAEGDEHPTYFETLFLIGMLIFQWEKADYVVLEVGMGGRLDATNVIRRPLACIIASISLDHTEYLGDTIAQIAGEKAGIIKPGVPVVYDGHTEEAAEVIAGRAAELGSPAYALTPDMYKPVSITTDGITFDLRDGSGTTRLRIPNIAEYQMMNASLAFSAMRLLTEEHHIPPEKLVRGIGRMVWPCRMETVADGVIVDGAHNPDGVDQFVRTVQHFHRDHEITILFSAVADKRYDAEIRELAERIRPERVVTTKISGSREVSEDRLAELFRESGCREVYAEPTVGEAYEKALRLKGDGMLFCVGSLYLAGAVKAWIGRREGGKNAEL